MSSIYLVHVEHADWLTSHNEELAKACSDLSPGAYKVYNSTSFVDGTGYMQNVFQEIDFVLQSNAGNCTIKDTEFFLNAWGLEKYVSYNIADLSGGWKKFLGLALFTNIQSEAKIYIDSFRQLSDRLIAMLIAGIKNTGVKKVFFFEYDVSLYPRDLQPE